jgi:hypothetical protein
MRRQTVGEVDAPAIEELTAGGDGDEHRRVTVLGHAHGRYLLRSRVRHVLLPAPGDSKFWNSARVKPLGEAAGAAPAPAHGPRLAARREPPR